VAGNRNLGRIRAHFRPRVTVAVKMEVVSVAHILARSEMKSNYYDMYSLNQLKNFRHY
jgi:hypothetical protein